MKWVTLEEAHVSRNWSDLQNLTVGYSQQLVKSWGSQSLSQEMNSANDLNVSLEVS